LFALARGGYNLQKASGVAVDEKPRSQTER
jgi:hypothetical protein